MGQAGLPAPLHDGHDPKKGLPGICGATFQEGTTRKRANIVSLQLILLDVDNAEEFLTGEMHPSGRPVIGKRPMAAPALLGPICDELARLEIAAYAWSTWSSTPAWPRFRLVIPLAAAVPPDVWGQLGDWAIGVSGLSRWRSCLDLPVLRDTARLNFLPAQGPGGPEVERRQIIAPLLIPPTPAELARVAPPPPIMAPWQKEALERRQAAGNGNPTGASGRHSWAKRFRGADGRPLDMKELDAVRLLEALGCQVGPARPMGGATKHRTTCPWPSEQAFMEEDGYQLIFVRVDQAKAFIDFIKEARQTNQWRGSRSHSAGCQEHMALGHNASR